jgi:uroporphyrinogen-III synthase
MSEAILQNVRVIVTRPPEQAHALENALSALGADVMGVPGLVILPAVDDWAIKQQFQDLDCYQHLIFTSVNAVQFGMQWIDRYWPQWPVGVHCYSVGPGTASALTGHGVHSQLPQQFSSEGLLALPALQNIKDQRVLIVKGQGGRTLLKETLQERNAQVDCAEVYSRACPEPEPGAVTQLEVWLAENNPIVLLLSSVEVLENLKIQLASSWNNLKKAFVLVISERIAQRVRLEGFTQVTVSPGPSNDIVINTLISLVENGTIKTAK